MPLRPEGPHNARAVLARWARMIRAWGLIISCVAMTMLAGCTDSREAQEEAAYEWSFRRFGLAIGTTLPIGGPSVEEITHYRGMGVITAAEAEAMIAQRRAAQTADGSLRITDDRAAIAAVTGTRCATELAKRVRLQVHVEEKRAYGYVVYVGEDQDTHTVLVKRLLVKEDGSVWDSADTDWDEKSFTIPLD
jgi:hypothetical protein